MNNGSNTIKSKTMTRVREEEEDAKPRALGPSKKSQIIVTSGRQQRPPRAKRSCSSPAAEGGGLDRHTFHSSSSSLSTATTTTKKHHHRRSASSSVSWKCEGATTEDSGLDQFIAANNRGVVFDFVNSFSSSGSKASLPNGEDEDEDGAVDKNISLHARPPPPPPSSGLASSNLKPPPPSSTPRVVRDINGSEKDEDHEVAKPRAAPSRGAAKPPPPSSSFASSSTNLKRPPPPASRVGVVRDNNKDEFLFIEENNRNALIDFVRSVSSSTSVTTASTSATSKTSSLAIDEYDDEYDDDDVENQKKKTKDVDCVCISKREAARQLERARVGASVGERQREVAVKTLMFFALAISLFVLNQKIRSTAPDGSDTPYFTTVVEQMLSGIERIRTERQTGPD